MRSLLRFVLPLVAFLGLLAWGGSYLIQELGRRWFERDVDLRAQLVVNGARESLAAHWKRGDDTRVENLLAEIARDERILAAAACGDVAAPIAMTPSFPTQLSCDGVRAWADAPEEPAQPGRAPDSSWSRTARLAGGSVRVNAVPLDPRGSGFVVLVQDLSYADRRAETTRRILLGALAMLALVASIVTVLVVRFSWRTWTTELRGLLNGRTHRREFQPLLRDIRELVDRLVHESQPGIPAGPWTPERLKTTLTRHLQGEKVVIVANREPYIHERGDDGRIRVLHPASGLVTALEPVMRACSGTWVAHGSGSADRETVDRKGRVAVPPGEQSYVIRRVWLTREEEKGYYYGFSNEGLWPLCHIAHARPVFRASDWAHYQRVNRRFADAVCDEVDSDDPIVFVQDYHFALAPRLIRERLPRATILTFFHIPWPNPERFGICPWHRELLEGLLGSSILGFHTQLHCNNFLGAVDRYLEARLDREQQGVVFGGRTTLVRPYPISIEWPNRWAESAPPVAECRATVRAELGLPAGTLLGLGVDRLDYTKGIEERLLAVERLLERFPHFRGRFTFVQLAAPSRTLIERYRHLNERVGELAERINERFGHDSYRPVILLRRHHEPPTVFRFYRAADVCYVSSLHDGMNLVAKEFVAARDDEQGVLVLSTFTGAARELTDALVVNPYDLEQASAALAAALTMTPEEQRARMAAMRSFVAEFNVYRWAGRFLVDAARLRERDRRSGSFLDGFGRVEGGVA